MRERERVRERESKDLQQWSSWDEMHSQGTDVEYMEGAHERGGV